MKLWNTSIDILKFFAVLSITNSHMELLYGKYNILATGGAVGDALFFFASGFIILLGRNISFANYLKRRINRIYPTVFGWAIMTAVLFNNKKSIIEILLSGGGWFVSCIMIYYLILFFLKRYFFEHIRLILVISLFVSMILYTLFVSGDMFNMYGNTYYKWCHFFIFMLQGGIMGIDSTKSAIKSLNGWIELIKILVCMILFYVLCAFKSSRSLNYIQVFSLLPLLGITYNIYRLCNSAIIKKLYNCKYIKFSITFISGLCLEIYLVQYNLFTDRLNFIFPLNIPIIFLEIVIVAYLLRCLGRIWSQTFKEADYQWKEVFKLV